MSGKIFGGGCTIRLMNQNLDGPSFIHYAGYILVILALGYSVAGLVDVFFLAFEPPHWIPVGGIVTVIRHATFLMGVLYVFHAPRN